MPASRRRAGTALAATALALLFGGAAPARADLMLTQAGQNQQFTLSTFANNFPNEFGIGPMGIAFPSGGGVLVSDYPGNVRFFANDVDNQNASAAVQVAPSYGRANAIGLAQQGGAIYMTQQTKGTVAQINPDGTFNRTVATGIQLATGIVANPANGHLIVSTIAGGPNKIYDVDPATGKVTALFGAQLDGLTITPDGKTLYGAAENGHLLGFNLATGKQVFDSGFIPGDVDGAVLGTGTLAGNIFVNTNDGTLVEVNLATGMQTLLASGGSRGDFVTVDPNDGSLLLTQTDSVLRLAPPSGGGFGGFGPSADPPSVPEPSSLALLALGGGGLVGWRRWKRRR